MSCQKEIYHSGNVALTQGCSGVHAVIEGDDVDVYLDVGLVSRLEYIDRYFRDNKELASQEKMKSIIHEIQKETVINAKLKFASIRRKIDYHSKHIEQPMYEDKFGKFVEYDLKDSSMSVKPFLYVD